MTNSSVMAEQVRLDVIIPICNEGVHLRQSLEKIEQYLAKIGCSYTFILVDDGSSDKSWEIMTEFASSKECSALALQLSRNFGKEAALSAGLDHSTGDAVVIMDADLQHPPSLLPLMVEHWLHDGYDIVEAVKTDRGKESFFFKYNAKCFYRIFEKLSGLDLKDASDYKLLSRLAVEKIKMLGERTLFFRGMAAWVGLKRKKVGFEVADRVDGRSRWSSLGLTALALDAIVAFSPIPLYLVFLLACVFLILSLVLGARALYLWFFNIAIGGFTTVIILNLIIGSFMLIALGIIGIYLGKIYEEVKRRPRYILRHKVGTSQ